MTNYFKLEAPYPAIASVMLLPSPKIGNNVGLLSGVNVITMMDGSRRSFIQRADNNKRHRWDFTISSDKVEEFVDFIERYRGATFRVTWRNEELIGKVSLSPVEISGAGRAGGWPGGESYRTTLELVEVTV